MAQLSKGDTFSNGEQVTASRLNQLVDSATLTAGAITDQPNLTANTLASDDSLIAYDLSATALKEIKASDILNSGLPITTGSITGNASADLTVTPSVGQKFNISGDFAVSGNSALTGNETITGTLAVTGASTLTSATLSGNLTVNGDFNATGTLKVNGTVGYVLYSIVEENLSSYTATVNSSWNLGYTSGDIVKPSDEIWEFTINTAITYGREQSGTFRATNNAQSTTFVNAFYVGFGSATITGANWNQTWVINSGTEFGTVATPEKIKLSCYPNSVAGYASINPTGLFQTNAIGKLTIKKYKTA